MADISRCDGGQVRLAFTSEGASVFGADIPCGIEDGSFGVRLTPGIYHVTAARSDDTSSFPDGALVLVPAMAIP